ncbi:hypothetical protein ACVWXO_006317 [Bradyrhizobium sp. LM2.7]
MQSAALPAWHAVDNRPIVLAQHPKSWQTAGLYFGDDLVSDFVIEARPPSPARPSGYIWTSRLSATGATSLSRSFQFDSEKQLAPLALSLRGGYEADLFGV